ncbi:MAG: ABC transporter substrate-binding protein [Betaproteobacteria bacterium]|nr:ABC transporter substrate-binding protein [Betaproteobacteria bacterium]
MIANSGRASRAMVKGLLALIGAAVIGAVGSVAAAPSGPPIRIGGTLALTGPLASTAMIHKIVGDIYIENLNKANGLLGRPVEWVLYDDQSKPDVARALYDKLVTGDKVDLLIGPYATGAILSAVAVAERHSKMLVHHTFGIPKLAKYERHFSASPSGYDFEVTFPTKVVDALLSSDKKPKTIAIVTSKFSSVHFMSVGARDVAKKRGMQEVLYLEFEFGNRDFGPIAARVRDANADFLWMGGIALEGNMLLESLKKLDYTPKNHFHLYPAPGPLANAPEGNLALSGTAFEDHPPLNTPPVAAAFTKTFKERAIKANLPYVEAEIQAANSFTAWQILEVAITATKSLDDNVLTKYIKTNRIPTINGLMRFDGQNNFGDDLFKVKQVQNGKWVIVWPPEFAPPGTKIILR